MKKSLVIGIVFILAVIGVGVAVKFSQNSTPTAKEDTEKAPVGTNPASEIGEGEVKLTSENFAKEIKEYKGVALVDMYSPTCGFCQKVGPVISEIAKENQGKYKVGKISVLAYPEVASEYKIERVPGLIFFKDGQEVDRLTGYYSKEEIVAKLEEVSKK